MTKVGLPSVLGIRRIPREQFPSARAGGTARPEQLNPAGESCGLAPGAVPRSGGRGGTVGRELGCLPTSLAWIVVVDRRHRDPYLRGDISHLGFDDLVSQKMRVAVSTNSCCRRRLLSRLGSRTSSIYPSAACSRISSHRAFAVPSGITCLIPWKKSLYPCCRSAAHLWLRCSSTLLQLKSLSCCIAGSLDSPLRRS
jgi:hypothetical protein